MLGIRTTHVLLLLLLATATATQAAQSRTITMPFCFGGCGGALHADPATSGTPVAFPCSFDDPMPPGATIQALTITASDGNNRQYTWMNTPTVGYSIDGQQIGTPQLISNYAGPTCSGYTTHVWSSDYYPSGFPGYVYGGTNSVVISVVGGDYTHDVLQLTLQYDFVLTMTVDSGSSQTGAVQSPLELPLVARMTGPPGFSVAGQTVIFSVGTEPNKASGTAVGDNESTTSRAYSALTDALGFAHATAVLGSAGGTYTFTAQAGAYTSSTATFTATAIKPSSVAILKNSFDLSTKTPSYTLLFDDDTQLTAIGLDKSGSAQQVSTCSSSDLPKHVPTCVPCRRREHRRACVAGGLPWRIVVRRHPQR